MVIDGKDRFGRYFEELASFLGTDKSELAAFYADLRDERSFLEAINERMKDVPQFHGKRFADVGELRVYRSLLYVLVRYMCCRTVVETGVLHGFSSAFILLGLEHNGEGQLISIDIPGYSDLYRASGTDPLPNDKSPGWVIPDGLRHRHKLILGPSIEYLPLVMKELDSPLDMFLHDSDHSYLNMTFEMSFCWSYLAASGMMVIDNVERNDAFTNFARGLAVPSLTIASFDTGERIWKHGLLLKPAKHV